MAKRIALLGSTGVIGRQALEVVGLFPHDLEVVALAAGENLALLAAQAQIFQPRFVSIAQYARLPELAALLKGLPLEFGAGEEGLRKAVSLPEVDLVLNALSGFAGLFPTLEAIRHGKDVALANKESLVVAGELVTREAQAKEVKLLPVDSEHAAIFQCLAQEGRAVEKIILTASGGPFLNLGKEELARVTPAQALRHPTWKMGPKVTIDAATLMNKGLEVIEAHWLFGVKYERIEVLIHPESIVHGLVVYQDGVVLAELALPDMRLPIQFALTWPEKKENRLPRLDLAAQRSLTFYPLEQGKFPCFALALKAGKTGGSAPAVLNAADEVAVAAFLAGKIPFTAIPVLIEAVLSAHKPEASPGLEEIRAADQWAREKAKAYLNEKFWG